MTKPKKKTKIQDISATRTRRTSAEFHAADKRAVRQHRHMTTAQRKAYLARRKATVLHPDDVPHIAEPRGWKEGVEYIVDKRARILIADRGDEEEE